MATRRRARLRTIAGSDSDSGQSTASSGSAFTPGSDSAAARDVDNSDSSSVCSVGDDSSDDSDSSAVAVRRDPRAAARSTVVQRAELRAPRMARSGARASPAVTLPPLPFGMREQELDSPRAIPTRRGHCGGIAPSDSAARAEAREHACRRVPPRKRARAACAVSDSESEHALNSAPVQPVCTDVTRDTRKKLRTGVTDASARFSGTTAGDVPASRAPVSPPAAHALRPGPLVDRAHASPHMPMRVTRSGAVDAATGCVTGVIDGLIGRVRALEERTMATAIALHETRQHGSRRGGHHGGGGGGGDDSDSGDGAGGGAGDGAGGGSPVRICATTGAAPPKHVSAGDMILRRTRAKAERFAFPLEALPRHVHGIESLYGMPQLAEDIMHRLVRPLQYDANWVTQPNPLPFQKMQPVKFALLSGAPGMGKTHAVMCIIRELMRGFTPTEVGLYKFGLSGLRDTYAGAALNDIKGLFEIARDPGPATRVLIYWIDEVDQVCKKSRGEGEGTGEGTGDGAGDDGSHSDLTSEQIERALVELMTTPIVRRDVVIIILGTTNLPARMSAAIMSRIYCHIRFPARATAEHANMVLTGHILQTLRAVRPDAESGALEALLPSLATREACAQRYHGDMRGLVQRVERAFHAFQERITPEAHRALVSLLRPGEYPDALIPTDADYRRAFDV